MEELHFLSKRAGLRLIPSPLDRSACCRLRKADVDERAVLAMGSGQGGGRFPGIVETVHLGSQGPSADAQFKRELNFNTTAWLAIEDSSARYGTLEHFFKAKRLGTQLNEVAVCWFAFAALVFNRE